MSKAYVATVVAIFVTTSLATNLLVVGARGPVTLGLSARMRTGSRRLYRRVKYFIDNWVAAMLSRRERQASAWALHSMSDRELKDIGGGKIGRDDGHGGLAPRAAFSIAHPLEEGL